MERVNERKPVHITDARGNVTARLARIKNEEASPEYVAVGMVLDPECHSARRHCVVISGDALRGTSAIAGRRCMLLRMWVWFARNVPLGCHSILCRSHGHTHALAACVTGCFGANYQLSLSQNSMVRYRSGCHCVLRGAEVARNEVELIDGWLLSPASGDSRDDGLCRRAGRPYRLGSPPPREWRRQRPSYWPAGRSGDASGLVQATTGR